MKRSGYRKFTSICPDEEVILGHFLLRERRKKYVKRNEKS